MRNSIALASATIVGVYLAACSNGGGGSTEPDSAAASSSSSGSGYSSSSSGSSSGSSASSGSSSSSGSSTSSGSGSSSGSSSSSSSGASLAPEAGTHATECTAGAGTTMQAKWDFAVSAATLNGGKGQVLMVHKCDTVVWTNDDNGVPHSVVSTSASFAFMTPVATGTAAGATLGSVRFTKAGTFTYHCGVHLNMMIGQITVQ